MKTTYVLAIMAIAIILTATGVAAKGHKEEKPINNGFNTECQNFYGSDQYFTIEKWSYGEGAYVREEQNTLYSYYDIKVEGDLQQASWTSRNRFYAALVKAGNDRVAYEDSSLNEFGRRSGAIESAKDISHITFCGKRSNGGNDDDGGNGVPEFPAFAAGAAVLAATLGIVFLRKN